MITAFSRITITLTELLSVSIVDDNLKRKTLRDPLLSVRIFKNDSTNWSVSDQYMNLNDYKLKVQEKCHRIMKTKSFRFIFSTMTSSLFLSMRSSDDWKYDVSKSRSIVMICAGHIYWGCIRWTSFWWLILRSKSNKKSSWWLILRSRS